jgi:UbiD family decarboxylase
MMVARIKARTRPSGTAREYPDLHQHVAALDAASLLVTVDRPINKDTEMHPLVRWQFRGGIAEQDRKAFLFRHPVDSKGRRFDIPVLIGGMAANREIYRIGMGVPLESIGGRWLRAMDHPIAPRLVDDAEASCYEIVVAGDALDVVGQGLDGLPIPISTPGWDNAPYVAAGHFITVDPDTGIQNMGNYRGQIKAPRRMGMNPSIEQRAGIYLHWLKYKALGQPMPTAVVIGCPPCVAYAAVQKLPERLDELAVAGGLVGSPVHVVKGKTVDLLVPAEAEIVVEGYISTDYLEPEAPFGESHGYVNLQEFNAVLHVTAITRRRAAILPSFISQVTPSESSTIKRVSYEPLFLDHLQMQLGIKGVKRVSMHEPLTGVLPLVIIQLERDVPETEVWRALYGAATLHRFAGKWVLAVNDDIDPENSDMLFWAMCFRCQPQYDLRVLPNKDPGHGPRGPRDDGESASVLINATLRGRFPPVSLPKKAFMEHAATLWAELGLPALKPEPPWYGYSLGDWPEEFERQAELAVRGDYWATGDLAAQRRRSDVEMNTPVTRAASPPTADD